jgi:hypothetical protein
VSDTDLRAALRDYEAEPVTTNAGALVLEARRANRAVCFAADGKASLDPPLPLESGMPLLTFALPPAQAFYWSAPAAEAIRLAVPRVAILDLQVASTAPENMALTVFLEQHPGEAVLRFREHAERPYVFEAAAAPTCSVCFASDHVWIDCPHDTGPESFRGSDFD